MKRQEKLNRWRNPLFNHPLMTKGGAHEKTKKAQRRQARQQLRKEWGVLMALLASAIRRHHSVTLPPRWLLRCR